MSETRSGVQGARAKIEDTTSTAPTICVLPLGTPSSASSFVAIGNAVSPYDKFEIGVTYCSWDCPNLDTNDIDTVYYYRYGRAASTPCGSAVIPTKTRAPKAHTNGSFWFQIVKVGPYYYARVAGIDQYAVSWEIDLCWAGATWATYGAEHRTAFDQWMGRVADPQDFTSLTWQDSSGTHAVSRTLSANCDLVGTNGSACKISGSVHDAFRAWDTRQP